MAIIVNFLFNIIYILYFNIYNILTGASNSMTDVIKDTSFTWPWTSSTLQMLVSWLPHAAEYVNICSGLTIKCHMGGLCGFTDSQAKSLNSYTFTRKYTLFCFAVFHCNFLPKQLFSDFFLTFICTRDARACLNPNKLHVIHKAGIKSLSDKELSFRDSSLIFKGRWVDRLLNTQHNI